MQYKLNDKMVKRNLTSVVSALGLMLTVLVLYLYPVKYQAVAVGISLVGWYVMAKLCLSQVKKSLYLRVDSQRGVIAIDRIGLPPKEILLDKVTSISAIGKDSDVKGVVIGLIPARSYFLIKDIFESPQDFTTVWQQLSRLVGTQPVFTSKQSFAIATCVFVSLLACIHVASRVLLISPDELFQNFGLLTFSSNEPLSRYTSYSILHIDTAHLVLNLVSLGIIGEAMERLIGRYRLVNTFAISVIGGGLLSAVSSQYTTTVGASGGLYGLLGAYVAAFFILNKKIPSHLYMAIKPVFLILALDFIYALFFSSRNIDITCHAGGLLTGFFFGWWSMASFKRELLDVRPFEKVLTLGIVVLYGYCLADIAGFISSQ